MAYKIPADTNLDPGSNGIVVRTALNVGTARTITGTTNQITVTNGNGVSGNPTLSFPTTFFTSGTFTPTIIGTTTAGTGTYVVQVGRFQRTGNTVWLFARVQWSAHTGTGNMHVGNLPFLASTVINLTQVISFRTGVGGGTVFTNPMVWGAPSQFNPVIIPLSYNNTTGAVAQQAIVSAGELIFEGVYEA